MTDSTAVGTTADSVAAEVAAPIETVNVTVTLPKAEYDMVQALVGLVKSVKAHAADGFSLTEVPAVILENLTALKQAVGQAGQLPAQAKAAPSKLGVALAIGIDEALS